MTFDELRREVYYGVWTPPRSHTQVESTVRGAVQLKTGLELKLEKWPTPILIGQEGIQRSVLFLHPANTHYTRRQLRL